MTRPVTTAELESQPFSDLIAALYRGLPLVQARIRVYDRHGSDGLNLADAAARQALIEWSDTRKRVFS